MQVIPTPAAMASSNMPRLHSIAQAMRSVVATEGFTGLWRGVHSVILGAGYHSTILYIILIKCRPSHALYFATYEEAKMAFGFNSDTAGNNVLATGAAGACATIVSDALMNPFDGMLYCQF